MENESVARCENCRREKVHGPNTDVYNINLVMKASTHFKRRKFKHILTRAQCPRIHSLCEECNYYLTSDDASVSCDSKVAWPAFVWSVFKDKNIQEIYGTHVWKLIPHEWRAWWINSLLSMFPNVYSDITITNPKPIFRDKTNDLDEWNIKIKGYLLSDLAFVCNKYLLPTIKCPWGCSEFMHKVGYLPIDVVWQRYLPACILPSITPSSLNVDKMVRSAREDYFEEETWLFNPIWQVSPSLAFHKKRGPVVFTCRNHDGGTKLYMIHPCRWKHNLASKRADQLCQAVINPRIIKPVQASKYSTSFQMFQQSGTFNGIDTCSNTSFGNFDFKSLLIDESEARSISNRPDINNHLNKLKEDEVISDYVEKGKRDFATRYSRDIDYDKYCKGGSFVGIKACINMQRDIEAPQVEAIMDHRESQPIRLRFVKYWSLTLYPCQPMNSHGVIFSKVPSFKSKDTDTRVVWTVAVLMCRVETLWQIISRVELHTSRWHGWMLVYLTKQCFNNVSKRQKKNDPYKYQYISTVTRLLENCSTINSTVSS